MVEYASSAKMKQQYVSKYLLAPLELARLERLLDYLPTCTTRSLHLGDVALAPSLDFVTMLAPLFGVEDVLGDYPAVQTWWQWVQSDEAVAAELGVMRTAVAGFFGG